MILCPSRSIFMLLGHSMCIVMLLCPFWSIFMFLGHSVCIVVSLYFPKYLYVSRPLHVYRCFSLLPRVSLCFSATPCISLFLCTSQSIFMFLGHSMYIVISLYFPDYLYVSRPLHVYRCFSVLPSVSLSFLAISRVS